MKKVALVLIALLIGLFSWWFIHSGNVTVIVNGEELAGPMEVFLGGWGMLVAAVLFFCVAILLAFVLAGVGLAILGILLLITMIFLAMATPLLLPLLLPLLIVWAFIAWAHRKKQAQLKQDSTDSTIDSRKTM